MGSHGVSMILVGLSRIICRSGLVLFGIYL